MLPEVDLMFTTGYINRNVSIIPMGRDPLKENDSPHPVRKLVKSEEENRPPAQKPEARRRV
jgi:hypothetical protein